MIESRLMSHLIAVMVLGLAVSAAGQGAIDDDNVEALEGKLSGKVGKYIPRGEGSASEAFKPDLVGLVRDPALAARLAQQPPRTLSDAEVDALYQKRLNRVGVRSPDWSKTRGAESFGKPKEAAKWKTLDAADEQPDSSGTIALSVIGAFACCGFILWRMRRN